MDKSAKGKDGRKAAGAGQLWLRLPGLVREALYHTAVGAGLACVDEVLEAERVVLCGERYGVGPVSLTVLGKKDQQVSQCREPIHRMRGSTGGESSNWRAPGAAWPNWRASSRPRPTRSVNGSSRRNSMSVCAATV